MFAREFSELSETLTTWAEPWWFVFTSVFLMVICAIAPLPLRLDHHELTTRQAAVILLRRLMLGGLLALVILFPVLVFCAAAVRFQSMPYTWNIFSEWVHVLLSRFWPMLVLGALLGIGSRFTWKRYAAPWISREWRKRRMAQHTEKQSDVRDELDKLKQKNFSPEQYYKLQDRQVFLGLTETDEPIYMELDDFLERHMMIVGATGQGKGVAQGYIIDQTIRMGLGTWFCDPKGDDYIPFIMKKAADDMGVDFIYLNLNPNGYGLWSPFSGGTMQQRKARLVEAFGMADSGDASAFYKLQERSELDDILEATGGHIMPMLKYVEKRKENFARLFASLKEWSGNKTFNTKTDGRSQFSIERSIEKNAVVYVRGSTTDNVVKGAMRVLVNEVLQLAMSMKEENRRPAPLYLALDELRFIVSETVAGALATSRSSMVKMSIAFQTIGDLLNLEDRTLNSAAISDAVIGNCHQKIVYATGDVKSVEWASLLSGTKFIDVVRTEATEINAAGGEKWGDVRQLTKAEEAIIPENMLRGLPARVGILYLPNKLAQPLFTCWMKSDLTLQLHKPIRVSQEKQV